MQFLEKNKQALEKRDPLLYEAYLSWEKEGSGLTIEKETARDGSEIVTLIKEGKRYRLNSRYAPQREAREWSEQFSLNNIAQRCMLFGLGNGSFARELLNRGKEDMGLLIYEPDAELFQLLMQEVDLADLLSEEHSCLIVKGLNDATLYGLLYSFLSWNNLESLVVAAHPQYDRLFPEEWQAFRKEAREGQIRVKSNNNTVGHFGRDMLKNIGCSLGFFRKAQFIEQYIGKFSPGVPAIIVAAGPSLDLNIEELKQAEGKAVIFATDTAMRDLIKHGVRPDFLITVDPRKPAEYLKLEECRELPLLCFDVSNREIMEFHTGRKIFLYLEDFADNIKRLAIPAAGNMRGGGGSVATTAFSACTYMKFKTIILVGQDLAYRNGVSHAGGRMSGEELHGDWLVEVEDIYGNIIKTRHEWFAFLEWFEDAVETIKDEIEVIDATEGGAKIKGTKIMPLREAIQTYCRESVDCQSLVEELGEAFTEESYAEALSYMETALRDNEKTAQDVKKLIFMLEALLSNKKKGRQTAKDRQLPKEILRLGERVEKRPVYSLEELWTAAEANERLQGVYTMTEDEEENEEKTYWMALEFYKGFQLSIKETEKTLKTAYETMKKA